MEEVGENVEEVEEVGENVEEVQENVEEVQENVERGSFTLAHHFTPSHPSTRI